MHRLIDELSLPGVSEVEIVSPVGADPGAAPALLFEVPHGATRETALRPPYAGV